ncbi:MAG: helix-turn-helix transcriptional regulator [Flavobacteriales bacterium]|nr:helix-turn-helix transcriptional regulator [Flavobacteriales bacterium]
MSKDKLPEKVREAIKNELPVTLGQKIRQIRTELGLSQTELAEKIGNDRQYMSKIELGDVNITVVKLAYIAEALQKDIKDFL